MAPDAGPTQRKRPTSRWKCGREEGQCRKCKNRLPRSGPNGHLRELFDGSVCPPGRQIRVDIRRLIARQATGQESQVKVNDDHAFAIPTPNLVRKRFHGTRSVREWVLLAMSRKDWRRRQVDQRSIGRRLYLRDGRDRTRNPRHQRGSDGPS